MPDALVSKKKDPNDLKIDDFGFNNFLKPYKHRKVRKISQISVNQSFKYLQGSLFISYGQS